jgi:tetratricopeptide (TPR) repeat protein
MAAAPAADQEYYRLLIEDDAALEEVNRWVTENEAFRAAGGGLEPAELTLKIATRLKAVVDRYEEFLKGHPHHVEGRIAFGSFLNEMSEEEKAAEQWEQARLLNPKHPAPWNNLANHYGHFGAVSNAFPYYARAIELNPTEPIYYQNLATTVYLFRRDAERYYGINEQQVFDKALELYRKALELSPGSFPVATDLAQTYYGIQPFRLEDAMKAWEDALKVAQTDLEKQHVYLHFARLKIRAGDYAAASNHLAQVTLPQYDNLKQRLYRSIELHRSGSDKAEPEGSDDLKLETP